MSHEADIADLQSSDVGTSSLRTQLIEAQILDFQLEGEDQEVELFLTSDFSLQLDDCNAHESTLQEIDDSIIRLRKWQLEREILKEEIRVRMLEESRFDIGQRATPAEDSLVETETEMESNNREEETQKCRLDHEAQLNRTKISLTNIESLLNPTSCPRDQTQCLDLSRLSDQNERINSERIANLEAAGDVEEDTPDSNFRQLINEARKSSCISNKSKVNELIASDQVLESDAQDATDRFRYFSSALDSFLLQSDSL